MNDPIPAPQPDPAANAASPGLMNGLLETITRLNQELHARDQAARHAPSATAHRLPVRPHQLPANQTWPDSDTLPALEDTPPVQTWTAVPRKCWTSTSALPPWPEDARPLWVRLDLLPCAEERLHRAWPAKREPFPPTGTLSSEETLRTTLLKLWQYQARSNHRHPRSAGREILIGPSGSGKTTCLNQWLTRACLAENRSVQVWRLHGTTANTAESLSLLCQGLGIPLQRAWTESDRRASVTAETSQWIDLPGINWQDPEQLGQLKRLLRTFGPHRLHLVLNAAYDLPVLWRQTLAFEEFPVAGLILTHMEEVPDRVKLWNLILGTNLSIRFLSAGQNVPGTFLDAAPEHLLPPASA